MCISVTFLAAWWILPARGFYAQSGRTGGLTGWPLVEVVLETSKGLCF